MKKSFYILILTFSIFLTFSGCQNFLQGSILLEQIEDSIAYAKAPETTIYFMLDDAKQGTIFPNGPVKYKVNPKAKNALSFNISADYVFKYWE